MTTAGRSKHMNIHETIAVLPEVLGTAFICVAVNLQKAAAGMRLIRGQEE